MIGFRFPVRNALRYLRIRIDDSNRSLYRRNMKLKIIIKRMVDLLMVVFLLTAMAYMLTEQKDFLLD